MAQHDEDYTCGLYIRIKEVLRFGKRNYLQGDHIILWRCIGSCHLSRAVSYIFAIP